MDPLKAREQLEDILSQKEYQAYSLKKKSTLEDLLANLQKWIQDVLEKLFPETVVTNQTSEWISYGFVGIGIAIVLFLLIIFSSKMVRENRFYTKPVGTEKELILSPKSHLSEAERLFREGELRSALRHLFLAYILHLHLNQWIEARPWKTNGEYLDELQASLPEMANVFQSLALKFEATWYGGRSIRQEDYLNYRNQVIKLIEEPIAKDTNQVKGEKG